VINSGHPGWKWDLMLKVKDGPAIKIQNGETTIRFNMYVSIGFKRDICGLFRASNRFLLQNRK